MSEVMDMLMQQDETWKISDDRAADWAMRKIKQAREDSARWKAYYQAQLEKITAANDATECFFTARLQEFFENVPHHETETQSKYRLPSGELVMKRREPEYKVVDQAASTAWLEENELSDYVEIKKSVRWSALKKVVTAVGAGVFDNNGEQVPGIQVTPRDPEFTVSIK